MTLRRDFHELMRKKPHSSFATQLAGVLLDCAEGDATDAFRYFRDETPANDDALAISDFPNITPPRFAALFLDGEALDHPIAWVTPSRTEPVLTAFEDIGLTRFGALYWEEKDALAEEYMPPDAKKPSLPWPLRGLEGAGRGIIAPSFWWRIPVGCDGRAKSTGFSYLGRHVRGRRLPRSGALQPSPPV